MIKIRSPLCNTLKTGVECAALFSPMLNVILWPRRLVLFRLECFTTTGRSAKET